MQSEKLNLILRRQITDNVCKKAFEKKLLAAHKARAVAGDAFYRAILGHNFKAVQRLPESYFVMSRCTRVAYSSAEITEVGFTKAQRLPTGFSHMAVNFNKAHESRIAYVKAHNALENLEVEANAFRIKIDALCASVNSTKRLVEIWPEAKPFIPAPTYIPSQLPVTLISDINAAPAA